MKSAVISRLVLILALLSLASLACSMDGILGGPPAVGEVVVCKSLDSDYKPVDPTSTYTTKDTFFISVEVNNLIVGSVIKVKYKFNGADYEETILTEDEGGSGYYGFKLSTTTGGHEAGDYSAEIYLDDKLAKTVKFKVK